MDVQRTRVPSVEQVGFDRIGQCHHGGLPQQAGRGRVHFSQQGNSLVLRLVDSQGDLGSGDTSPRGSECAGRFPQPSSGGLKGMVAAPVSGGSLVRAVGPSPDRSICNQPECEAPSVLFPDAGPGVDSGGCFPAALGVLGDLRVASTAIASSGSGQGSDGPGVDHIDHPVVASSPLVSAASSPVLRMSSGSAVDSSLAV